MSSRSLMAGLPLVAGSALILMALLPITLLEGGAFMLEWMGSFLAFYGLSYLLGSRPVLPIAGAILVAGSLGDITLIGGLNPVDWITVNYMVFIHAALGSLAGRAVRELPVGN